MKKLVSLLLVFLLAFGLFAGCAEAPQETQDTTPTANAPTTLKCLRILAIGNSFSVDAMEHLYAIAAAEGVEEILLGNLVIGGCSLETHVAKAQSDKDAIYNNANVNRVNEMIAGLADGQMIFYIDVNELFDDENGNLSEEHCADSFHVFAKDYKTWVDWLCTKAIVIGQE